MPMGASCARTRSISVVFPAPEGPDTMNKVPSGWKLLDILHLLAYALDFGLQFYNDASQRRRARLRAHGVDLAQHLLRKKIELLPAGLLTSDGLLDLIDVMRQPRQLLGDVAFLHHEDHFLRDAVVIDLDARRGGDLPHALLIRSEQLRADLLAMLRHALLQRANVGQTPGDVG